MPFTLETWKAQVYERLWDWRWRLEQSRPASVYGALCATALWPLWQAAQGQEFIPAVLALGSVTAGIGSNLLAEQVQRWKDRSDSPPEAETELARWIKEQSAMRAELRDALDAILAHMDALPQAQARLAAPMRQWFDQALREELTELGNLRYFEAHLSGSGAVAQGSNARAVGASGLLIEAPVAGDVLGAGARKTTIVQSVAPGPEASAQAARQRYLARLRRYCQALPLAALGGDEGAEQGLTLEQVYIALDTTTAVPKDVSGQQPQSPDTGLGREQDTRPLSALEAAAQTPRLVLLGDPGAGKSTFVRQLLAGLAAYQLGEASVVHGAPGDVLPVLITLRDLAPRLAAVSANAWSHEQRRQSLAAAVRDQAVADLQRWEATAFADELRQALVSGRCLLVLDGLDEVPYELRERTRDAVLATVREYDLERVIVTCRVRSYGGSGTLSGFHDHTLAAFDKSRIEDFAQAWYNAQKALGRIDAMQAEGKAKQLAAVATSALRELASNPMMLTTMAIIHQSEVGLPKERVRLYNMAVEVLLRRWQRGKVGDDGLAPEAVLTAVLADDRRLRPLVERLAYEAHRSRQNGQVVTDLPRGTALTLLEQPGLLGDVGLAAQFLDYVDQRAGLIVGQGGVPGQPATYSFPHRTFQEYLAGCYLVSQKNIARCLFTHAQEGDFWGPAVQLGVEELFYNLRRDQELLELAYRLCAVTEPTNIQAQRAVLWSGNIMALIGHETVARDVETPDSGPAYLERLRPRLVALLRSDLTAPERAEAGRALAHLGDPRFRADAWYLPDEDLLGFVEIPAGTFCMGSDNPEDSLLSSAAPQHVVDLPRFYMARYPVTVAQFRAFVEATHETLRNPDCLLGVANHPVVSVSWHEALAYCDWLTRTLRQWSRTPQPLARLLREEGWCVTLPSEAEWEKAARGTDGRRYPWGNELDPDRANYDATGIRATSTVGCFPGGVSPYTIEELSGNVWEWTRSLWGSDFFSCDFPYPYHPADGREQLQAADHIRRVVRGGSSWFHHQGVRCAYRSSYVVARGIDGDVGFRVLVRPCL